MDHCPNMQAEVHHNMATTADYLFDAKVEETIDALESESPELWTEFVATFDGEDFFYKALALALKSKDTAFDDFKAHVNGYVQDNVDIEEYS